MVGNQHVLSKHPLNAEPSPTSLVSSFLTPVDTLFHRNHGEWVDEPSDYLLHLVAEAPGLPALASSLTIDELKRLPKVSVTALLACAGNRREEMSAEKETEGLQWGKSAISNCQYGGVLLRDVLARVGITLEEFEVQGKGEVLHIHFESAQKCEDDDFYGSSLPIRMALDPERPVLLAYEMNGAPLTQAHGAPLRLVVPGVIGARSVKWLEKVAIRDKESECFYVQRDCQPLLNKILPPEATPETKEAHLKQASPLMEFPLNAEICDPEEGAILDISSDSKIRVRGYAVGSKGIPIASVRVALVPLPVPAQSSPFAHSATPEIAASEVHQIRLYAAALPGGAWSEAELDAGPPPPEAEGKEGKHWGWTLFSASLSVPPEVAQLAALAVGGEGAEVALVAYATDDEGQVQEVQTPWNLRGVAEASWSVVKVKLRKAVEA
ncbi:hypothetical protein JCM10450v2_000717 [Rhodotorula kratochvilovae]